MKPALRINAANADHHLWNNNGTWFVHYTIRPNAFTKERVRRSLRTKSLRDARRQRDRLLSSLGKEPIFPVGPRMSYPTE